MEETPDGEAPDGETPAGESPDEETLDEETPDKETPMEDPGEPEGPIPEVIYNLGDWELRVGRQGDDPDGCLFDGYFDENGCYAIQLEDNPFFPYEVQFQYNGQTFTEWFMDETDAIEVGPYTFSTAFQGQANHIGFTVGGEYHPAFPEEKTFTTDGGISAYSLLPLKEKRYTVDLTRYIGRELSAVEISTLLTDPSGQSSYNGTSEVVWCWELGSEPFQLVDGSTIDLSTFHPSNDAMDLQFIVGTADQLNPDNTRYIVKVILTNPDHLLSFSAKTDDGTVLSNIGSDWSWDQTENDHWNCNLSFSDLTFWDENSIRLGMNFDSKISTDVLSGLTAKVFFDGADITDKIWGPGNYYDARDYSVHSPDAPQYFVVFSRNGNTVHGQSIDVHINCSDNPYSLLDLALSDSDGKPISAHCYTPSKSEANPTYRLSVPKTGIEKIKNALLKI